MDRLDLAARMPFQITTSCQFAAAHQLLLYDGTLEPLHGHNWKVRVVVESLKLDSIGVVMDFHDLDRQVHAIIAPWHNRHLNEVEPFTTLNPSTEHVALAIGQSLTLPDGVYLAEVEVWETEANSAIYRPVQ
jgi:6-pyruvoyltetrahydropterin/6-carboxytetrahydropterin synthase